MVLGTVIVFHPGLARGGKSRHRHHRTATRIRPIFFRPVWSEREKGCGAKLTASSRRLSRSLRRCLVVGHF